MSLTTSIGTGGTNSRQTTAEEANALATDILNAGVIGTTANTSGVAPMTGGFAVNAQGSPDTTVAVSAGVLWTTATPTGGNSQKVRTKNSASANVTIAANATGATRYDWIYLKIDPDKLANSNSSGTDIATLTTSRSTSATTDNGTPPTYGTLLAVVTVANGFSTITNGTIADRRTSALTGINSASSFFAIYDFVESGCVWSGDAYASTLAASMTAGYLWLSGTRLSVAAVTARAFTASKDTYIDASNNGDGTALLTYTEVTNNAASPALTAGSIRLGIVVSGGSNIAAATSINQGQETRVLPIASSIAYTVTDSLGNLICPRDPNRKLLGYRQITTAATVTNTTTVTQITGLTVPVIVPTGRKIEVELFTPAMGDLANNNTTPVMEVWDGVVSSGTRITQASIPAAAAGVAVRTPAIAKGLTTPSATSKTYNAGIYNLSGTSQTNLAANATAPTYLKITLA